MSTVYSSRTLGGEVHTISEHMHSVQMVCPEGADPITVTAGAGAWELGNAATLCNGTIASVFDIHFVDISAASANDYYELLLYDDGDLIAEVSFTKSATSDPVRPMPLITPLMRAASVITAKLRTSGGGGDTCGVKFWYHTYS